MTYSDFREEWFDPKPYIVAHTSGSTGQPKEIRLLKEDMRTSARATNRFFSIGSDSVLAIPLSFDYIAAKMMAVRSFEADCKLQIIQPKNEFKLGLPVTLLSVVPSQALQLANHPEWSPQIDSIIIGGAPLTANMESRLLQAGYNAYCSYGMTETCSHVALRKLGDTDLFHALPGISFEQDDRECLVINAPDFSFKRIVTNDIAEVHDEHSFRWKGRYDNVIISGGVKIFPEEVEQLIAKIHDGAFYVRGAKDEKWGECLEMVMEGSDAAAAEKLMEKLRKNLPHMFCPKRIIAVERLERTSTGKLKRKN